jgi:hypothetical protein
VERLRYAATIALLLIALPAAAPAQSSHGAGGVLCRDYLKAARSSGILYHQASNWLLGYVSGINAAAAASGAVPPVALGNDRVLRSAGDYCEANPTQTIAGAAAGWTATLPKPAPAQQQTGQRSGGGFTINLDRAPERKPLLDRR